MTYYIRTTPSAAKHFLALRAFDRARLQDAIAVQLRDEPTVPTRHRKKLQTNPLATWELRVGDWRVLYDVAEELREVLILAIGRKIHDRLIIHGEEHQL